MSQDKPVYTKADVDAINRKPVIHPRTDEPKPDLGPFRRFRLVLPWRRDA